MAFFIAVTFFLIGVMVGGRIMKFGEKGQKAVAERGWIELDGKVYRVIPAEVK